MGITVPRFGPSSWDRKHGPLDYLYTLRDMSMVHEFEWDEHILCDVTREVKNTKIRGMRVEGNFSSVDVYQCFR